MSDSELQLASHFGDQETIHQLMATLSLSHQLAFHHTLTGQLVDTKLDTIEKLVQRWKEDITRNEDAKTECLLRADKTRFDHEITQKQLLAYQEEKNHIEAKRREAGETQEMGESHDEEAEEIKRTIEEEAMLQQQVSEKEKEYQRCAQKWGGREQKRKRVVVDETETARLEKEIKELKQQRSALVQEMNVLSLIKTTHRKQSTHDLRSEYDVRSWRRTHD